MVRDHLVDTMGRGEPLAGLWASESVIYGRYGFGVATENEEIEVHQTRVGVEGEHGSVRLIDADEARGVLPALYDAVRSQTPGMLTRDDAWWKIDVFFDPEKRRNGFTSQRYVLHEMDGVADGYAIYRQKGDWSTGFPNGTVRVREVVTPSSSAHTGIWRFLTSIDLFPNIRYWNLPVDDPIRWKVPDHRRIERKRWDALYVRILDVTAALEARTFAHDGTIRFTVDDRLLPGTGGTFELVVIDGIGRCRRVDDAPSDIRLGIGELSSLYLGNDSMQAMARAGVVTGTPDAVVTFGRMLRGDAAPWCEEVF